MKLSLMFFTLFLIQNCFGSTQQDLIENVQNKYPYLIEQKVVIKSASERQFQKHISPLQNVKRINLDKATQLFLLNNFDHD